MKRRFISPVSAISGGCLVRFEVLLLPMLVFLNPQNIISSTLCNSRVPTHLYSFILQLLLVL